MMQVVVVVVVKKSETPQELMARLNQPIKKIHQIPALKKKKYLEK